MLKKIKKTIIFLYELQKNSDQIDNENIEKKQQIWITKDNQKEPSPNFKNLKGPIDQFTINNNNNIEFEFYEYATYAGPALDIFFRNRDGALFKIQYQKENISRFETEKMISSIKRILPTIEFTD
jgi:hypothetical protein